jgi:2-C-methyl-D-erythritol 4-phosphate cytidylyltransferase
MEPRVTVVLLAAGKGARVGARQNKVYLAIAGRSLLSYALAPFIESPAIEQIVLVVGVGEKERVAKLVAETAKVVQIVHGGARRQDSALAGVKAAEGRIVLIHDAARPFPSRALIDRVIEGARKHGACVPVIPAVDTLRHRDQDGFLLCRPIEREGLLQMQTPQGFKRGLIYRCLEASDNKTYTDDAGAVLAKGIPVWTVSGESTNLKVTTEADLALAEAIASCLISSR